VTLPAGISLELSPLLADFVKQREEGRSLPRPFPESEWLQIFTCAVRDESRFEELESTWANLRVLLACNFDDLECGEVELQGALSKEEGGDSMSVEQREYSQGTLTVKQIPGRCSRRVPCRRPQARAPSPPPPPRISRRR